MTAGILFLKRRRSCQPKSDLIELFLSEEENFASVESTLYYSNSKKNWICKDRILFTRKLK